LDRVWRWSWGSGRGTPPGTPPVIRPWLLVILFLTRNAVLIKVPLWGGVCEGVFVSAVTAARKTLASIGPNIYRLDVFSWNRTPRNVLLHYQARGVEYRILWIPSGDEFRFGLRRFTGL